METSTSKAIDHRAAQRKNELLLRAQQKFLVSGRWRRVPDTFDGDGQPTSFKRIYENQPPEIVGNNALKRSRERVAAGKREKKNQRLMNLRVKAERGKDKNAAKLVASQQKRESKHAASHRNDPETQGGGVMPISFKFQPDPAKCGPARRRKIWRRASRLYDALERMREGAKDGSNPEELLRALDMLSEMR